MTVNSAHHSIWQTSEAVDLVTLIMALVLEFLVFEPGPLPIPSPARILIGCILVVSGILIVVLSKKAFSNAQQSTAPGKAITKIVTTDIFQYSRNPIYLGDLLIMSGVGVIFDIAWLMILIIPMALSLQWL